MLAPWLWQCSFPDAAWFFLIINGLIVLLSVILWILVRKVFSSQPVFDHVRPINLSDVVMTCGAVVMNAIVSLGGWWGWKAGYFSLAALSWERVLFDFVAMLVLMDVGMYVTHRLAHIPVIYDIVHRRHHDHTETNALSLFVLSPLEVLGFGTLLVGVTALVGPCEAGLSAYLAMNLIVGTIGHAGVEPLPRRWLMRLPLGLLGTSTFHARHHADRNHNFGFYTTIWDRLCRTLGD
ncbi:MAG: sterol desaturase family protein [Planctomycetaceae bacterium]